MIRVQRHRQALAALLLGMSAALAAQPALAEPTPEHQQAVLDQVDYKQHIGTPLPEAIRFLDSQGETASIGELSRGKPTLLALAWYNCPQLCPMLLDRIAETTVKLPFDARDYRVVIVSIAPEEGPEDARHMRAELRNRHGDRFANWHFLSGRKPAIDALAKAAGFRYAYDEQTQNYAHPAGVIVATPEGTISHYLLGMRPELPDLRFAMMEASDGELGSPLQQVLVRCYRFDPTTGRYNLAVIRLLQVAGVTTVIVMLGAILWMRRRYAT